ncbi:MAG: type I-B CRISPR-associated protein Cas8b1/Cst1 [Archaeoglobi archaeon]|nr:type I-B CRISPR-associated protein Cas8b1/Cst1 [Candidatus Mnemosynella bozhongmuii]
MNVVSSENTIIEKETRNGFEFYWTGHPFVDAGLTAILLIAGKNKPEELTRKDVERAIEFASELYATKDWSSSYLHGMIFPNSGIVMSNPSMSKKRSPEAIAQNLWGILEKANITDTDSPTCIICGRKPAYTDKEVYLSVFPLLGTGGVTNYFHSANPKGVDICAHCIFLAQFLPLASYRLSRVLVIHAYPYELMLELSKDALNEIRKSKLASQAKGFRIPENFLFHLIGEITTKVERDEFLENASITLYYFICNLQNQILDIIYIPNPVVRFVAYANKVDPIGWRRIVAMGWKGQSSEAEFENFERERRNEVYSRLLNYESILSYFYDRNKRMVNASWNLLAFYCKEVMGMDKETLEFIKSVGDRIVESIEKLPDHKLDDEIRSLERAEKLYQFEAFFIRIEKLRQSLGVDKPLMTFDEFTRILTAYGEDINVSWRTVKNLLLFRIYEKLHERLMKSAKSPEIGEVVEESEYAIFGGDSE